MLSLGPSATQSVHCRGNRPALGLGAVAAAVLSIAGPLWGQEAAGTQQARPGLIRVGPVYLTPTLRVGQVGYDSNVFYTATDRTTDFVADGGPGLELLLPIGSTVRFDAGAGVDVLYFARTESQRRTTWNADVGLAFEGSRTLAEARSSYVQTYRRPGFEVDTRILEVSRVATVGFNRRIGRNALLAGLEARRLEIEEGQFFGGADLARNLNRTTYRGLLGFHLGLTSKTSFVVEGDYQRDEFEFSTERDADSNRLYGGLEIDSATRLSGRAVGGARSIRPREADESGWFPYLEMELRYRVGPRTALGLRVSRDQDFSAFTAEGGTQTSSRLTTELSLGRRLWGPVELRVFGGIRQLETDGAIEVAFDDGRTESTVRKDDEWFGGTNLGVRFRDWFRIGVEARYNDRRSTFADLGLEGLVVGVTVQATPGDLVDLVLPE